MSEQVGGAMHWTGALSQHQTLAEALEETIGAVRTGMAGRSIDLLFIFASPVFAQATLLESLQEALGARVQIGCSGGGIVGRGREVEGTPALSLLAAHLPGAQVHPFEFEDADLPDSDSSPTAWEDAVGVRAQDRPAFVLLVDSGSFPVDALLGGLDFAFAGCVKIGGLASGASRPGGNRLFLGARVRSRGAVGIALSGNIRVEAAVAQGCRPVGPAMRITQAEGHMLWELDGKPALAVLQEIVQALDERDRSLAARNLFVGVLMNEFRSTAGAGDFLIRNLMGIEPRSGSLSVGAWLRNGQTVRFHLRDGQTSADDLQMVLQRQRLEYAGAEPAGALLFSCLGRGEYLYGAPDVDTRIFGQVLGTNVPLAGFFCNGEIGPVGMTTFLHGYTSSFAIFRPGSAKRPLP